MLVSPNSIHPSQDFLKENTIRFILQCFEENTLDELPPTPIVRKDSNGELVAIDGHNLLAVKAYRGEDVEVIVAYSTAPIFPETSEANSTRNLELKEKYERVLEEADRIQADGIKNFDNLIAKYPELFQ